MLLVWSVALAFGTVSCMYIAEDTPGGPKHIRSDGSSKSEDRMWLDSVLKDTASMAVRKLKEVKGERDTLKDEARHFAAHETDRYIKQKREFGIPDTEDEPFVKALVKDTATFISKKLKEVKKKKDNIKSEVHNFARMERMELDHYVNSKNDEVHDDILTRHEREHYDAQPAEALSNLDLDMGFQ